MSWGRLPSGLLSASEYTDETACLCGRNSTSTTYSYRVYALVDGEQGDRSNVVSVSIPASGVLPPAPTLGPVSATSASSITVSWSTVPAAASYELRFKVEDGAYGTAFSRATLLPSYVHRGRTAGTEYTYQVRSKNVNGYSDWSAAESATTPAAASGTGTLPTPRNLRIEDATEPILMKKTQARRCRRTQGDVDWCDRRYRLPTHDMEQRLTLGNRSALEPDEVQRTKRSPILLLPPWAKSTCSRH